MSTYVGDRERRLGTGGLSGDLYVPVWVVVGGLGLRGGAGQTDPFSRGCASWVAAVGPLTTGGAARGGLVACRVVAPGLASVYHLCRAGRSAEMVDPQRMKRICG